MPPKFPGPPGNPAHSSDETRVILYSLYNVVLRAPVLSECQSPAWGVFEVLGLELIPVQLIT